MADRMEALLRGLDGPRPVPPRMRERLEGAMVSATLAPADENLLYILDRPKRLPADMKLRLTATLTGEDESDIAARFAALDAPRPIPAAMRARLIDRLTTRRMAASRQWQMFGAAAAAVLILVGTVFFSMNRGERPGSGQAIKPTPTVSVPVPSNSVPPTVSGSPKPSPSPTTPRRTQVLGVKETRIPATNATGGTPAGSLSPASQPTGGLEPVVGARSASRANAPAPPASTDLVGSVVGLVRDLLAALNLDVLSAGNSTHGIVGDPAASAPAAPSAGAATPAARRSRTAATPKTAAPAATATPADRPKPLIQLPLLSEEPAIVVEVPVVELTISL